MESTEKTTDLPQVTGKLYQVIGTDCIGSCKSRFESYLDLDNFNRNILIRFRISAHSLRIEKGRHQIKKNTIE